MSLRIASSILLFASVSLASPVLGQDVNLIVNPGFDGGPAPWRVRSEPGRYEARWDSLDRSGSSGSGSVYTVNRDISLHGGITQTVPVIAGETYRVAAAILTPPGQPSPGDARATLIWQRGREFLSGAPSLKSEAEGDWVELSHEVVAPAGATHATITLGVFLPEAGTREAYFDDVFFGLADPGTATCTASTERACLGGRFEVEVEYRTSQNGGLSGVASPVSLNGLGISSGALFSFFSADNPEMLLKVLDGCAINGHYWVFYSAGTNVFFRVTVTDLQTGRRFTASNPDGNPAPPLQEFEVFPCG